MLVTIQFMTLNNDTLSLTVILQSHRFYVIDFCHSRAPGGAAADYVSTSSSLPLARPFLKLLLTPAKDIAHEEYGCHEVM